MRQLLASGLIDPVRGAEIEYAGYLPDWHPYEDYRQSYAARAELGGGVVLTHIHDYDLAWWLFGAPQAVLASGGRESALEIDVEDTVRAELTTPAGRVFVSQSFASKSSARRIVVHGSVGTVTVDLIAATLDLDASLGPGLRMDNYPRNAMFRDEVTHFLECVDHGMEPKSPLSDGVAVLRVALAVKESMRSGTRVELR